MSAHRLWMLLALVSIAASFRESTLAGDPPPPSIQSISSTNGQKKIHWTPYPAAQQYKVFGAEDLYHPLLEDTSGSIAGFDWESSMAAPLGFYRLQVVSLDSSALLVATVLNRLAYGPTPDELERVTAIGPQ